MLAAVGCCRLLSAAVGFGCRLWVLAARIVAADSLIVAVDYRCGLPPPSLRGLVPRWLRIYHALISADRYLSSGSLRDRNLSAPPSHFARRLVAHASPSLGFTPLAPPPHSALHPLRIRSASALHPHCIRTTSTRHPLCIRSASAVLVVAPLRRDFRSATPRAASHLLRYAETSR